MISDSDLRFHERFIKARLYRLFLDSGVSGGWPSLARLIFEFTGVKIPSETLRQNIMPTNRSAGIPPRTFSNTNYLRAVYDFTLANHYIRPIDLSIGDKKVDAALSLSEFLNGSLTTTVNDIDITAFSGLYTGAVVDELTATEYYLQVDAVDHEKSVFISFTEEVDDGRCSKVFELDGWLIHGLNGLLLIFVRDQYDRHESMAILQTAPAAREAKQINALGVFRYGSVSSMALQLSKQEEEHLEDHRDWVPSLTIPLTQSVLFLSRIKNHVTV